MKRYGGNSVLIFIVLGAVFFFDEDQDECRVPSRVATGKRNSSHIYHFSKNIPLSFTSGALFFGPIGINCTVCVSQKSIIMFHASREMSSLVRLVWLESVAVVVERGH